MTSAEAAFPRHAKFALGERRPLALFLRRHPVFGEWRSFGVYRFAACSCQPERKKTMRSALHAIACTFAFVVSAAVAAPDTSAPDLTPASIRTMIIRDGAAPQDVAALKKEGHRGCEGSPRSCVEKSEARLPRITELLGKFQ